MAKETENSIRAFEQAAADISGRFGFTRAFSAMLARRGLVDDASILGFLHPESRPLPDPFSLSDMDRAVRRIRQAIEAGERICVYGDYDTDGVCATAILTDALKRLGADCTYLLPSRFAEGYGLNKTAVDSMHEDGIRLIVTVDNGISAHAEIAYANSLGMDTVITDHHRCHETLPDACAVVCAARSDQEESLHCLCGATVAMLTASALGCPIAPYLPLAALATMADVVPLLSFNRTIVKKGLPLVITHPGLKALLDAAGVQEITGETSLSFILAPRINAAGRMGDATRAVRLLLTDDVSEREALAAELESENIRRRAEEQRIFAEAEKQITDSDPRILILKGTDWNTGVVGIVASRLVERYHCPALLFSEMGGTLTGSGRSVPAVDLFALLTRHKELFLRYGGHLLAAGATIEQSAFEKVQKALTDDLIQRFPTGLPEIIPETEDRLSLSEITPTLAREISYLAPFGEENRAPLFLIEGSLSNVRRIGRDGTHLTAKLSDGSTSLRIVSFGSGDRYADWNAIDKAQAHVSVELSSYQGKPEVSVRVDTIESKVDETVKAAVKACIRAMRFGLPLPDRDELTPLPRVTEAEIRTVYRSLQDRLKSGVAIGMLNERELTSLLPLVEIGVVEVKNGMFLSKNVQEKKQIQNALLYPVLCLQ